MDTWPSVLKLELNKCLKCGTIIIKDSRPTSVWTQRAFLLQNGNIHFIGLCNKCSLEPKEYKEASSVLALEAPIVDIATTGKGRNKKQIVDTYIDILKDAQGGKCFYCGKKITDKYAISGGHISCEIC